MDGFSKQERTAGLERMSREGVDVFIIGGGITGVSVAMDAAARGYRVGLVEKSDFASGTSSKSTKLVHGGIRYLPQFDFALVHEALTERGLLFQNAPWIVSQLGFVLPLYRWNKRPLGTPFVPPFGIGLNLVVETGLLAYDLFAGKRSVHRHQRLSLTEGQRRAPALKKQDMTHAFVYYDGQTDDTRLTMTVLRTAARQGALAANYTEVSGFDITSGHIRAVHICDTLTDRMYTVHARHVINAAGVFAQRVEELTGRRSELTVEAAKGVHLVFSREKLPMGDDAVVLPETDDGRLLFLVPWEERVIVGTTDTEGGSIDDPITTEEDVQYLLDHCRRYLNVDLRCEDILSTYAGYRPLVKSNNADKSASAKLSRSHAVLDGPAGMVSIVGGKLTTWRRMAEDTMNYVARRDGAGPSAITREMTLDGTVGWPLTRRVIERHTLGLRRDIRAHLGAFYGANLRQVLAIADEDKRNARRITPDLPYLMAEVVYACRFEMALKLDDVLSRRTRLVLEDRRQGATVAREVAEVMAEELGWDADEINRQIEAYDQIVQNEYQECRRKAGDSHSLEDSSSGDKKKREDWSNATVSTSRE